MTCTMWVAEMIEDIKNKVRPVYKKTHSALSFFYKSISYVLAMLITVFLYFCEFIGRGVIEVYNFGTELWQERHKK